MATSGSVSSNGYEGRYITFTWNLTTQNIKANTSLISWRLEGDGSAQSSRYKAGNFKVVIDGTTVYSTSQDDRIWLYDGTLVSSGNYTFNHNSQGQKSFNVSIQAGIYTYAVNCRGNGSFTLPVISRISDITAVNGANITDPLSVTYTEYVASYTNNLIIAIGEDRVQTINNYNSGASFTLDSAVLNSIYTAVTTAKTVNLNFRLQTYDGSTLLGTSDVVYKTFNINNSNPTIGSVDYIDSNSTTVAITGNNKYIIRNKSTLQVTVSTLTALNSATLSSITVAGGGVSQTRSLSGTSDSSEVFNLGTVNQSSNFTLTVTLTDSRGYTATNTLNILVYDYNLPTATINALRVDNYYTTTNVTVNATYASLGGHNTLSISAQYKKTTESSYSAAVTIVNGETKALSLDNNYEWNLKVIVADSLGSTTYNLIIGRGLPIWFVDRVKNSIGINCFPQYSDSLEVNGVDFFNFHSGDTETISGLVTSGLITTNATKLRFSIPLKKSYAGLTVSFTSLQIYLRDVSGNMTQYAQVVGDSNFTITPIVTSDNILTVDVDKTTSYGITNDTPVAVSVYATISFSSTP